MTSKWEPKLEWKSPEDITPYARNTKKHPTEQIDKIASQIHEIGFTQPIVVDKDYVVIAGHGRLEAARRLALKKVPVVVADHLDEFQVKAARIADNKVAESEWDFEMLRFELGSLDLRGFNMALTGFELEDVAKFLQEPEKAEGQVGDSIADQSDNHANSDVKQIILIFDNEQYAEVSAKMEHLRDELECDSNTDLLLALIKFYEDHSG